jgi:tetratricopeptide (TPR) repeat protein
MPKRNKRIQAGIFILGLIMVIAFILVQPVQADIAPPQRPPGSNPVPGDETTQVQMLEETVLLEVQTAPWPGEPLTDLVRDWAKVTATFTMFNQGEVDESMQVRFPLTDPSGMGDGRGEYPEIKDLKVWIDGVQVATTRATYPSIRGENLPPVIWAGFDVTFPVGEQVEIEVRYSQRATGYHPQSEFIYFLETGAGWKGPIGKGELIVRLPYPASAENVLVEYSNDGIRFEGADARWSFQDLEPGWEDNLHVYLLEPGYWLGVLDAQRLVDANPGNGEAWGTLARAYKRVVFEPKGWVRVDEAGQTLYRASVEAYEKAIDLAPQAALWHAGYAELLWHNNWMWPDYGDPELLTIVEQLQAALVLEPGNEQAWEILGNMAYAAPLAVSVEGQNVDYLLLTATVQPSPTPTATETSTPEATLEPMPTLTVAPPTAVPNEGLEATLPPTPDGNSSPFSCLGGMFMLGMGPLLVLVSKSQARRK